MKRNRKKESWNNNSAKNPYSIKPWKDVRKENVIRCPTIDPIIALLGAVLRGGFLEEGDTYFDGVCKSCSSPYNNKYCGSFWTGLAGVDHTYIRKKALDGGTNRTNSHTI